MQQMRSKWLKRSDVLADTDVCAAELGAECPRPDS